MLGHGGDGGGGWGVVVVNSSGYKLQLEIPNGGSRGGLDVTTSWYTLLE